MSGTLRVSVQAIRRAARLAGSAEEEVLRALFEDAGRPLPPKVAPSSGPFSTYHTVPKGTPNAAVEGADVPPSEPLTGEEND